MGELNLADVGEEVIRFKANGEERVMPVKDIVTEASKALNWGPRMQQVNQLQQQAEGALAFIERARNDPHSAIAAIKESAGIVDDGTNQDLEDYGDGLPSGSGTPKPDESTRQLEAKIESLTNEISRMKGNRTLDRAIVDLKAKFGDDVNEDEVISFASARGITDLEAAYKAMRFDSLNEKIAEHDQAQNSKVDNLAMILNQAPDNLGQIFSGGPFGVAAEAVESDGAMSVQEAFMASLAEVDI